MSQMLDLNPVQNSERLLDELVDDITKKMHAGQAVDLETYVAQHPEHGDRLRQILPAMQLLAQLSLSQDAASSGAVESAVEGLFPRILGDFRILSEIGRGGMGVVYEAEQISLCRRVALKVLPFVAVLDPRQSQRFRNEALAAACLDHPHIVNVIGTGCERGVHFYAMRYIDGQTLAEVIHELALAKSSRLTSAKSQPQPVDAASSTSSTVSLTADTTTHSPNAALSAAAVSSPLSSLSGAAFFRAVAELGAHAAEALAHAHQLGIIHRDVKPSNLMLDARGKLWVTDFGLAHIESAGSLTMSGDVLGTLRYMPPEQALGKRVVVDHRCDIYSLGATLYELLSLRPIFDGDNRQELLRQLAFDEPRPLRQLDKSIPVDLETILHKTLEMNPADRYASAQDLADDLRRFLEDRPTRARRPSGFQLVRKWSGRNKAIVVASLIGLTVALTVLIGSIGWLLRDHAARQTVTERLVTGALNDAKPYQDRAEWQLAMSAVRRAESLIQTGPASDRLQLQVKELSRDLQMALRLEEIRLERSSIANGGYNITQSNLDFATAFREYGIDVAVLSPKDAAERIQSRTIGIHLAAALDDWASNSDPEQQVRLLSISRAADPDEWRNRFRVACLESGDELIELAKLIPIQQSSARTLNQLGNKLWHQGEFGEALRLQRAAQQLAPDDFWINHDLASNLANAKPPQNEQAIRYYTAAIALRPNSPGVYVNLSYPLLDSGRYDEAIAANQAAVRLKPDYAAAHSHLGDAFRYKERLDDAMDAWREAIRLEPDYAGSPHLNLGFALRIKGQLAASIEIYREAIRRNPKLAVAHDNLGIALAEIGQWDSAIDAFREAVRLQPDNAHAHSNLGNALGNQGHLDSAIEAYQQAIRLQPDFADAHYNLGNCLCANGLVETALDSYRETIRLRPDHAEAHCNLGHKLRETGRLADALAALQRGHELGSKNPSWPYPSAQWVRECERLVDLDNRLPSVLSGESQPADGAERLEFAGICLSKHQNAAAARLFREALEAEPNHAKDLSAGHRYQAARAAVLTGVERANDAAELSDVQRAEWREQARLWMHADLTQWTWQLASSTPQHRIAVQKQLEQFQHDTYLAGVRDDAELAKLPESEQLEWRKFWTVVASLLIECSLDSDQP